jgi:hypothetical protein
MSAASTTEDLKVFQRENKKQNSTNIFRGFVPDATEKQCVKKPLIWR